MSADVTFEQEWAQVKSELSKLAGQTVPSLAGRSSSYIKSVSEREIQRRTKNSEKCQAVEWDNIEGAYRELYANRVLALSGTRIGYGSFCLALFSRLTTAKKAKDGNKTILLYVQDGRPPSLKDGSFTEGDDT